MSQNGQIHFKNLAAKILQLIYIIDNWQGPIYTSGAIILMQSVISFFLARGNGFFYGRLFGNFGSKGFRYSTKQFSHGNAFRIRNRGPGLQDLFIFFPNYFFKK